MFVGILLRDPARDVGVEFESLRHREIFETNARADKKLISVFTSHVIKTKIVTIQWITSRILDTIDDWYIKNLAKNQVSGVFYSRVICRSVSPNIYRALYVDTMFVSFGGTQIWRP